MWSPPVVTFVISCTRATTFATFAATVEFLEQLSRPEAVKASTALCRASVRVLVESRHRPARRQASVIVANLATTAELRSALLAWSAAVEGHGLVDSLVSLAMGDERNSRDGFGALGLDVKEEEIGTRRECMRALVGLAECRVVRDTVRDFRTVRRVFLFVFPLCSCVLSVSVSMVVVVGGGEFRLACDNLERGVFRAKYVIWDKK